MDKTMIVNTIKAKLDEINQNDHQLIIPVNFDPELLSDLSQELKDYHYFQEDLTNPFCHLQKLEEMDPKTLFDYLLQITEKENKPWIITQWFYTFIHNNFKGLTDTVKNGAILYNNGKSYTRKDDNAFIDYDQKYNIDSIDKNPLKSYALFSEIDYVSCSSSEKLHSLIKGKNIYSINTSAKLKERLSEAGYLFVNKIEQSRVQLFDKLSNDVHTRLREFTAFHESEEFRLNPVYFDGYLPNAEVQKIPLEEILKDVFKHERFRKFKKYNKSSKSKEVIGQDELIRFLLEQNQTDTKAQRDLFFVGSTGSGKSLIFQMAAYILKKRYNKMTLVVSPLKSLMKDQKDSTNDLNLNVEYDNSDLTYEEQTQLRKRISRGEIDIVYVSPEKLIQSGSYYLNNGCDIGLMVIDETHLVSTWGKTFRVDYGYLGEMVRSINKKRTFPILATTATSVWGGSLDTVGEIIKLLNLKDPLIIMTDFLRENINIHMYHDQSSEDYIETEKIIEKAIENDEKTLVYTTFAKDAEAIVEEFRDKYPKKRQKVGLYTGKQKKEEKHMNQNNFKAGKINTMVATKAFGMGIDVHDVKTVYHNDLPANLSEYMQEIGRAGRNGDPSYAYSHFTVKSTEKSHLLSRIALPPMWIVDKIFQHIAQRVKNLKGTEDFTISLEDIMYLFINAQKKNINVSDALQKARVSLFLIQKDLENRYNKPMLYRKSENYQYLYFTADENTGKQIIEEYKDIVRFYRSRRIRKTPTNGTITDPGPTYSVDITKLWETREKNFTIRSLVYRFFNESKSIFPGHTIHPLIMAKVEISKNIETIERIFTKILKTAEEFCQINHAYKTEKELETFIEERIRGIDGLLNKKKELLSIFKNQFGTSQNNQTDKFLFVCTDKEKTKFKRLTAVPKISSWNGKLQEILNKQENNHHIEYFFHPNSTIVNPILNILDILNLAKVSYRGGKNSVITMRCADTHARKCILTLSSKEYKCIIIQSTRKKQKKELEIAQNFYKTDFTNNERWDYLERYFLGEEMV